MLKKVSKEQALKATAFVAVFGITGIVAYAAVKAYKAIRGIDDVELDMGNDHGLSQMMGRRDE